MRVRVHSMQPPAVSHALPALLPLAIEPATRTSLLLPSRRLCTPPGLPPHWGTSASFKSEYLPPHGSPSPFVPGRGQSRTRALGGVGAARPELPRARSATRRVRPVGSGTPRGPSRPGGAGPDGNSRRAPWLSRVVPAGAEGRNGADRSCPHRTRPGIGVSFKLRAFYSKSQTILSPRDEAPCFPPGDTPPHSLGRWACFFLQNKWSRIRFCGQMSSSTSLWENESL